MTAMFVTAGESDSSPSATKFKNRNRMEIVANLLSIAKTGTLKTHLMYKANLSYVMITEYLDYLQESGLIIEIVRQDGTKLFQTSQKGQKYLEVYNLLQEIAGMNTHKIGKSRRDILE